MPVPEDPPDDIESGLRGRILMMMLGRRFGKLRIVATCPNGKWWCRCDCDNAVEVAEEHLFGIGCPVRIACGDCGESSKAPPWAETKSARPAANKPLCEACGSPDLDTGKYPYCLCCGRVVTEEPKTAAELALDQIAALCGMPEWEYPGQVVRDVQRLNDQHEAAIKVIRALDPEAAAEADAMAAEIQRCVKANE